MIQQKLSLAHSDAVEACINGHCLPFNFVHSKLKLEKVAVPLLALQLHRYPDHAAQLLARRP